LVSHHKTPEIFREAVVQAAGDTAIPYAFKDLLLQIIKEAEPEAVQKIAKTAHDSAVRAAAYSKLGDHRAALLVRVREYESKGDNTTALLSEYKKVEGHNEAIAHLIYRFGESAYKDENSVRELIALMQKDPLAARVFWKSIKKRSDHHDDVWRDSTVCGRKSEHDDSGCSVNFPPYPFPDEEELP
jgi:hypothetical protein